MPLFKEPIADHEDIEKKKKRLQDYARQALGLTKSFAEGALRNQPGRSLQSESLYVLPQPTSQQLSPFKNENDFSSWYSNIAKKTGINPNPDDPSHFYDYRAAYQAGAQPDKEGHWPSEFKKEGHPRLVLDAIDTRTGQPVQNEPQKSLWDQYLEKRKKEMEEIARGGRIGPFGQIQTKEQIEAAQKGLPLEEKAKERLKPYREAEGYSPEIKKWRGRVADVVEGGARWAEPFTTQEGIQTLTGVGLAPKLAAKVFTPLMAYEGIKGTTEAIQEKDPSEKVKKGTGAALSFLGAGLLGRAGYGPEFQRAKSAFELGRVRAKQRAEEIVREERAAKTSFPAARGGIVGEGIRRSFQERRADLLRGVTEGARPVSTETLTPPSWPPRPPPKTFTFPKEIEERFQKAKGIGIPSVGEKFKNALTSFWHKLSRDFEHLPRTGEFSQLRYTLHELGRLRNVADDYAARNIQKARQGLVKTEEDIYSRRIILDDLVEEAKIEHDLPFGFTKETLLEEHQRLVESTTPSIESALSKRKETWDTVKDSHIKAMDAIGIDVSEKVGRENYYRHQVLEYARNKSQTGAKGIQIKPPRYRGFLKKRVGSELDINTNYIEAEMEVMSQMIHDNNIARAYKIIEDNYSIYGELVKKARSERKKTGEDVQWKDIIPEGYEVVEIDPGNVFYMADSISAKLASQLQDGFLKELNLRPEQIKKILAVGGKRKPFVVKSEVAKTLKEMQKTSADNVGKILSVPQSLWKLWQLISPRRIGKYNIRNATGDADAAFVGSPGVFKYVPTSVGKLWHLFKNKETTDPYLQKFQDRGGLFGLFQAQEMSANFSGLSRLSRLGTATKDLNIWKKYWRFARLTTDFRESILRGAAFEKYARDMEVDPQGRPKDFGASIPEEVMALKNIYDRAYKLQNDLLGAYDETSVFGKSFSTYVWPFWRWKEVNMRRYARFAKNAAHDSKTAEMLGRKLLGTAAKTPFYAIKIGKFILKLTAFTAAVQAWNLTKYPEEEKQLPQGVRAKPHVILGRDKETGEILYFSRIGALLDILEWFSLDDSPKDVEDFISGKRSLKEIGLDMVKSPANIMWSGVSPFIKMPPELLMGKETYPDIFKPRLMRDRWEYLANSFGLKPEYVALMDKPSKGYWKEGFKDTFMYRIDPLEAAYNDMYNIKKDFQKKFKSEVDFSQATSEKLNALYNFKKAIKFKDGDAAKKYFLDYMLKGGKPEDMFENITNLHPLSGIAEKDLGLFIKSLNEEDTQTLDRAMQFYVSILEPTDNLKFTKEKKNQLRQSIKTHLIEKKEEIKKIKEKPESPESLKAKRDIFQKSVKKFRELEEKRSQENEQIERSQ